MKLDYMSLGLGVIAGYAFREAIGQLLSGKKDEAAAPAEDLGALHLGALQMNPQHLGALQMNPQHMGALQMNPQHMGNLPLSTGFKMNPKHMGALHLGAHSSYDQTYNYPRAAFGPEGFGALHLGALSKQH